jgi:hypothetical protein
MNHSFKTFTSMLLGAIAIVGCQQEPVDVNPNFNPETDEVNAAFVLSVSTGSSQNTKMGAANVQKADNFLGINNAKLILFGGAESPHDWVKSTDGGNVKHFYDLGPVYTTGQINATNNGSSSSNRVLQLTIPVGSEAALFYGKANNATPGKEQGKMQFNIDPDGDPAKTWFGVESIIGGDDNVAKYDATGDLLVYAINTILETEIGSAASYSYNGYSSTGPLDELSWKKLGDDWKAHVTQVFLAESMGKAYATFTNIKDGEYRAGSSTAVKAMLMDLYSVVNNTRKATSLNDDELNVQRLAYEIQRNFAKFFDLEGTNPTWLYLSPAVIKANCGINDTDWANMKFNLVAELNNYPYETFGIPEGAAQLEFKNNKFAHIHPNKALVTPGALFEPRKYVYPAELAYYVNSPLWVTSKDNLSYDDYPNGTTNWDRNNTDNDSKWTIGGWTQNKVSSSTRGVAIVDEIKYGVALMETNVAWTSGANSGLEDNRAAMTDDESNRTILTSEANFTLRGVLIGGVHPRYNWQYIPRALTTEEAAQKDAENHDKYGIFDGVIYDDTVSERAIPTTQPNYTLVFDNYNYAANESQQDVYVALEFVNGGAPFWGKDNLIPHDGVFYLGAKLSAAPKDLNTPANDQTITWPSNHQVPPINESTGQSMEIPRVFIQGFLTKATFKIGKYSLQSAYYTVPNLESSQMSFGLSVDLSWDNGYEYDIAFGNGDTNPSTPVNP